MKPYLSKNAIVSIKFLHFSGPESVCILHFQATYFNGSILYKDLSQFKIFSKIIFIILSTFHFMFSLKYVFKAKGVDKQIYLKN